MGDTRSVICPYCLEEIELYVDPDTRGSFVEDCAVCCRPWQVEAVRDDEDGELALVVTRAQ